MQVVSWLMSDPPFLSLQDCVQLNQYKLKDEIGKVNMGWVWGGMWGFGMVLMDLYLFLKLLLILLISIIITLKLLLINSSL